MDEFNTYAQKIKDAKPNMDQAQGEQIYGLFKQANSGDNSAADPADGGFEVLGTVRKILVWALLREQGASERATKTI